MLVCPQRHCVTYLHTVSCIYPREWREEPILIAPAATSQINAAAVQNHFGNGFAYAIALSPDLPTTHFLITYSGVIAWILISDYDDLSNHLYSNRRIVAMELHGPLINKQLIFASILRSSVGLN